MKTWILEQLLADRAAKRPVAVATDLTTGAQALVYADDAMPQGALSPETVGAARAALAADRSRTIDDGAVFVQVHNPPLRLILVGAVHIAQPLIRMAELAGYAVTVVDPRRAFATAERFPGVALSDDWPDDALESLGPDRRTAVVTLSHDPKIDDPALMVALKSAAFYVGALGSRKTHAARLERLTREGCEAALLDRIHAPVGLDIGAKSPAEIALSILAQITQTLRQTKAA